MHSEPLGVSHGHQQGQFRRTNSLTASSNRSNSMRSYTYNPKPSYVAGQPYRGPSLRSNQPRSYSLTSQPDPNHVPHRANSINSRSQAQNVIEEDSEMEMEATVTTLTTKMVDAQGRLSLITTKTIKTYADGSKEIETTTKNISRSGSRANSLTAVPRNSSLLSTGGTTYNLSKIDEDLHDFDYNYEEAGLKLNTGLAEPSEEDLPVSSRRDLSAERRREELQSVESSPSKPLRSILKSTVKPDFNREPLTEDKGLGPPPSLSPPADTNSVHLSPTLNQAQAFKLPTKVPVTPDSAYHEPRFSSQQLTPNRRVPSSPNSSIKFMDRVDTIPIPRAEPKQMSEQELYAKAMQVAMQNVYGQKDDANANIDQGTEKKAVKNAAKRNSIAAAPGVSGDYVYQNHHKEFASHSMRNGDVKQTTHKERVKEEKQKLKAQEKEEKQQRKMEEKERKNEEKELKNEVPDAKAPIETKKPEKKSSRGFFFGRRKNAPIDPADVSAPLPPAEAEPIKVADESAADTSLMPGSFVLPSEKLVLENDAATVPDSIPETAPLEAPSTHLVAEPLPKQVHDAKAEPTASLPVTELEKDSKVSGSDVHEPIADKYKPVTQDDTGDEMIEVPVLNAVSSVSSQEDEGLVEESTTRTSLDPWLNSGSPIQTRFSSTQGPKGEQYDAKSVPPVDTFTQPVVYESAVQQPDRQTAIADGSAVTSEAVSLKPITSEPVPSEPIVSMPHVSEPVLEPKPLDLVVRGPIAREPEAPRPLVSQEIVPSTEDEHVPYRLVETSRPTETSRDEEANKHGVFYNVGMDFGDEVPEPISGEPYASVPTLKIQDETGMSSKKASVSSELAKDGEFVNGQAGKAQGADDGKQPQVELASQKSKKKGKFKHKLFKYFVNSYEK